MDDAAADRPGLYRTGQPRKLCICQHKSEKRRKDGETLYKELKKNGILVRHFDAPRIENWLRITIGTPEQMQALMDAVDKILEV